MTRSIWKIGLSFVALHSVMLFIGIPQVGLFFVSELLHEAFGRFLSFYVYAHESLLMGFTPFGLLVMFNKFQPLSTATIWKYFARHFILTQIALLFGLLLGLIFWQELDGGLLPSEILGQPFPYYWLFISILTTLGFVLAYVYFYKCAAERNNSDLDEIGGE